MFLADPGMAKSKMIIETINSVFLRSKRGTK
jgi:hypothetical protein